MLPFSDTSNKLFLQPGEVEIMAQKIWFIRQPGRGDVKNKISVLRLLYQRCQGQCNPFHGTEVCEGHHFRDLDPRSKTIYQSYLAWDRSETEEFLIPRLFQARHFGFSPFSSPISRMRIQLSLDRGETEGRTFSSFLGHLRSILGPRRPLPLSYGLHF